MIPHLVIEATSPDGLARAGLLVTPHGSVRTPAFLPVGTLASVKSVTPEQLEEVGVEMLLCNAYHLSLRPGSALVRELGGLHAFMGWKGPILTDSGGFQVFSLAAIRRVTDEGVEFRSHIDGSRHFLGPREAIAIQQDLGADVIMVLDECPPHGAPKEDLRSAVNRSVHWARRCREAHRDGEQALFGIVQGGSDLALREECATELSGMGFDGYAIGGVSVGEEKKLIREVVSHTAPRLPFDRPRYLMGVGSPGEMVAAIAAGIDFFDCVLPTRNGRNGLAFTSEGPVRIRGAAHVRDDRPLDVSCACPVCRKYSRAYLRHLAHSGELLAGTLLSMHNIRFFQDLVGRARGAVSEGGLGELLKWCDERYPLEKPDRSRSAP